jgi:AcrR family transcriptional regulator
MALQTTPDTKARILAEAERLFAAGGYDGVSMREIAEACGVTKANIYYYFRDKESLYLEILQADMEALVSALDRATQVDGSCRERIARLARAYWTLMREKDNLIRLTLRQFGGLEKELQGLVFRYQDEIVRPVEGVLADGVRSGELRPLNTRLAATSLLGMLSIYVAGRLLQLPLDQPLDQAVTQTVDLFFDGAAAG